MYSVRDQLQASLLGRYTVERELGRGGMATVYLARDTKHQRVVALKVLDPELGAVLGADRFLSEIRVTANLQHPNLLPLFDSGDADGLLYYVMPFVEGETLRARLEREKQLPVDDAVRIAVAVANALYYAHERGVVHRDLKPENILFQAGQPVVADFGIALAVSNAGGTRVTQTGLSLGTPQYMSPEQATGDRAIDARADIYALGAVTYEMLAGEPPHSGPTAQAIIARLMTTDPQPLTLLRRSVPAHVAAAVHRSLEKLPADRFENAKALADALTNPAFAAGTSAMHVSTARAPRWLVRALVAASALAAAAIAMAAWLWLRPAPTPTLVRFELGLPDSVSLARVSGKRIAISRDGSRILVVGEKHKELGLYLRRIDEPTAHLVRGTLQEPFVPGVSPAFSADGEWIVFVTRDGIEKVPVDGGVPHVIAHGRAPSVAEDGTMVFEGDSGSITIGSLSGRDTRVGAMPDRAQGVGGFAQADMLPGSTNALVTFRPLGAATGPGRSNDELRLGVVSLVDGSFKDLGISGSNPRYVPPGHILFARATNQLYAAPFSLSKRAITGPATLLAEGVFVNPGGASTFAVSDNGTLVSGLDASNTSAELVAVDRKGTERVIPGGAKAYQDPRVSPDGKRLVAAIGPTISSGLWIIDLATGAAERLTGAALGRRPDWSRDGARVVFFLDSGGTRGLVSRAADRGSADQWLIRDGLANATEIAVGPPHGYAAIRFGSNPSAFSNRDIFIAPMDSMAAFRPFVATPRNEIAPAISADGRLLAYASDETGQYEIYVQPIPGPGPRLKVSVAGGMEPLWSPSGSTLYYRGSGRMLSADIGSPLAVTRRDSLFADSYGLGSNHQGWSLFPNGREFLMIRDRSTKGGLIVVLNWQRLLAVHGARPAER